MSLIREPKGVDFTVSEGHLDRQTLLETAEWLNAYRRQHDQSADLQAALAIVKRARMETRTTTRSK